STDEFNTSLVDIFNKLESDSSYQKMFKTSFPEHVRNPVNIYTFKTALAAYVASLTGFDTKWDKYMRGEGEVSSDAINGYNLFMGKAACGTCHFAPTFAGLVPPYYDDSESEVLGVPSGKMYLSLDDDMGRYSTQRPKEMADFYKHSFKTTTARFANQTGPYMHNGVFETMDEVLEFYNNGGGAGHNLEVPYQTLSSDSLHLNSLELSNLKAFIDAIND
ncbi:MAG: cytochrome c peroxidase, partial [Bacteroidia bacterium]